jgi:AraC family transcriptional regulator
MKNNRKKILQQEYVARINRAIDFIEKHIDSELNLEKISKAAGFSSFHFHRIFKAFTGETLNSFVKRLRVEKAAMMLISNPKYSITNIAFGCGFSSSQAFARTFREYFKMSPSEFCNGGYKKSKNWNTESKNWKDTEFGLCYDTDKGRHILTFYKSNNKKNMKVEIKNLPAYNVAYVRNIGSYKGNAKLFESLFGKLCGWAGPRNLMNEQSQMMSVYYDDPKVTDESKLRLDVCLVVPEDTEVEGEIGKQTLPAGEFAITRVEVKDPEEYEQAWNSIYRDWLPENGYEPDNRPCYEIYRNDPKKDPEGKQIVDLCVPVKPL